MSSLVNGFEINQVLLPAPSVIAVRFASSTAILWVDFVQTVLKGALSGYIIEVHNEIPEKGEKIILEHYEYKILQVSKTRIETIRLKEIEE